MLDPFLAALAAGLAKRAAEEVAGAAHGAWSALVRLVRRQLGADPATADALDAATQAPESPQRQAALAEALRRAVAADPGFGDQLRSLWRQVEIHAESGGAAGQLAGTGQQVIVSGQASATVNYLPVPDPPAIPHQVPATITTFVNRMPELSGMDAAVPGPGATGTGTAVVVLVGMPGVGKTELACQWTSRNPGRFPGGELFVDFARLRSRSGSGAALPEAAGVCLRSLGVDERLMPVGLTERINLYRTRSAEQARLVVLDAVTEPGQVRALLPTAPGSVVIATTERLLGELVKDGARLIRVEPLDDDSAMSLLSTACGAARIAAEPDAARAVVRRCGGHPEALQVAAARLVLEPDLGVAALANDLADEARRLAALSLPGWAATEVDSGVAAAFALSYANLPAPAQQLYRDLGVLPVHDITDELVQWVAADSRTALETLVSACLVHRPHRGKYRMHQLVRLHAAEEAATGPGRDRGGQVIARALDYYVVHASWADRAVLGPDRLRCGGFDPTGSGVPDPYRGDRRTGLAWLEAERANLLTALRAAVDAGLDEPAWQLAGALNALYYNHRHHVDWLEAMSLGVRAARRHGRRDVEAQLRCAASRAHTDLGNLAQARAELAEAALASAEVDEPVLQASVWEFRGRYLEHVDRTEAVQAYQRSIALNTKAGERAAKGDEVGLARRGVALGHYFLGCCHHGAGRSGDALPLLDQARAEFRELDDDRMEARATFSIGLAHLHQGSYQEAQRELAAAADGFSAGALWHYEIPAREALAELAARTGDSAAARDQLVRALRIEETAGGAGLPRLRAALIALN